MIPGQHKTKWVVKYIRTGARELFDSEADARTHILMWVDGITPVSLIPPLYYNEFF